MSNLAEGWIVGNPAIESHYTMIRTTIKIDAADTMTADRIRACAIEMRKTHELLWHYLTQAESGDVSPEDIAQKVENAIAAGTMMAVEAFGGKCTNTTICPATKS